MLIYGALVKICNYVDNLYSSTKLPYMNTVHFAYLAKLIRLIIGKILKQQLSNFVIG